jgi:4-diphosphocytidyl-2-C-methyl-D-erythritol kinase
VNDKTERAGAKVTLSLRVTGRRADGYHELDALVAIVDEPHDLVSRLDEDGAFFVEPEGSAPADATNLVWKARAALGSSAGLRLQKGIPTEAGLGGGSADAAATLRLLASEGVAPKELASVAAPLGADVTVCLPGRGVFRMRGIGDEVTVEDGPVASIYVVLATPSFGCATAAVYAEWDALGGPVSPRALTPPVGWPATSYGEQWRNDLEPAAIVVEPRLGPFRERFAELANAEPMLCGSGSTYYVVAPAAAQASALEHAMREQLDCRCVASARINGPAVAASTENPANSQ